MDLENKRRLFVDGVSVILEMGLVGGADFNQFDTAGGHNVRDAERPADFDQLTARDDGTLTTGQGRQSEHDRTGVIVDRSRCFATGQFAD